jgi:hypothetical protein
MKGKFVGRFRTTDDRTVHPLGTVRNLLRKRACDGFAEGEQLGSSIAHGDLGAVGEEAGSAVGAVAGGAVGMVGGPLGMAAGALAGSEAGGEVGGAIGGIGKSEDAASVVQVAKFPSCHGASCNCFARGDEKENCDGVTVYNGDEPVAAFGKGHGATRGPDGSVLVYRVAKSTGTQDAVIDNIVEVMRARLAAFREPDPRIAALNRANEALWRRGDEK